MPTLTELDRAALTSHQAPNFGMPQFEVPAFRSQPFTLEGLNPQLGVTTPSSRGRFPWGPTAQSKSEQGVWGAAENLSPLESMEQERRKQERMARRRSFLDYIRTLPSNEILNDSEQKELLELFPESQKFLSATDPIGLIWPQLSY